MKADNKVILTIGIGAVIVGIPVLLTSFKPTDKTEKFNLIYSIILLLAGLSMIGYSFHESKPVENIK